MNRETDPIELSIYFPFFFIQIPSIFQLILSLFFYRAIGLVDGWSFSLPQLHAEDKLQNLHNTTWRSAEPDADEK